MESKIQIEADAEALARAAASIFLEAAHLAVREKGNFAVALSGGTTPTALYSLLAGDSDLRARVPWQQTYFFFGDERHVPPDHPDSNYRNANDAMISRISVAAGQVFRVKGEYSDAARAAAEYEQDLRAFFHLPSGQFPRFDLVMLGMGPDGHTASLFPGTKALHENNRLVAANWVGKLYAQRITMTAPLLNHAALVMFMVHGSDKAQPLKAVLEGPYEPEQLPSQLIRPHHGTLLWLVDESAAGLLDRTTIHSSCIATTR